MTYLHSNGIIDHTPNPPIIPHFNIIPPSDSTRTSSVRTRTRSQNLAAAQFYDFPFADYNVDNVGSVTFLGPIPRWTPTSVIWTAVGKNCNYRSLRIRGAVRAGAGLVMNYLTMCLVYDRKPRENPPWEVVVSSILTGPQYYWGFEYNKEDLDFINIKRWAIQVSGYSALPNPPPNVTRCTSYFIDEFVDLHHLPIVFRDLDDGSISDIQTGALYLLLVSDADPENPMQVSLGVRVLYDDETSVNY